MTGATGFIGRHLMAELSRHGIAAEGIRRELDPATDWSGALRGHTAVVHLAAAAHEAAERSERAGDYASLQRVNALAAARLARDAAAAGVAQLVFLSTIGVHGDETPGRPFTEESPVAPRSLYARSKLEAERLLAEVAREAGIALAILRPTLVYGPGNPGNMLRLLRLLERGWPLPLAGIGNRRSLTYVGNLVSAIRAVLERPRFAGTYVVCDPEPVSTTELVRGLGAAMGRPARFFWVPGGLLRLAVIAAGRGTAARRLLGSLEADGGRLRHDLGWQPPFATREGLARTGAVFSRTARFDRLP